MINKGYDRKIAAKYAAGEVSLEDIGEPKNEPVQPALPPTVPPAPPAADEPRPKTDEKNVFVVNAAGESVPTITAMDFPQLYEALGVDFADYRLGYRGQAASLAA